LPLFLPPRYDGTILDFTSEYISYNKITRLVGDLGRMAGEFWFQLFSCVAEQEQEQRRRPRIDRSMIGQPMDFRHTGHVGSSDLGSIGSLQTQMRGKGGESINIQVPHILNARSIHDIQRHSIKA